MENTVREYVESQMKQIEHTMDVEKEQKREPEFGTPEYHEWLKIYHVGMYVACDEILEMLDA